jgi:GNAT superfamily N-acetyltransferase
MDGLICLGPLRSFLMSTPHTAIREYGPADFERLAELMIELQAFERQFATERRAPDRAFAVWYIERLLRVLAEGNGVLLVAVSVDSVPCGFVAGLPEEEPELQEQYFYIAELLVSERYRGSGLGTRLIAAIEDVARGRGFKRSGIGVLAGSERVHDLYRRLGYRDYAMSLRKWL